MDLVIRLLAFMGFCVPIGVLVHGLHAPIARPSVDVPRNDSAPSSKTPKRARHLKARGKSKHRRHRRHSTTPEALNTLQLEADAGELWRIKLPSGRFMYESDGGIMGSRHWFSLFSLRRVVGDTQAQVLCLQTGKCLGPVSHDSQRLVVLPTAATSSQLFWAEQRSATRVFLGLQQDRAHYLCEHAQRPGTFLVGNRSVEVRGACSSDEFELQLVVGALHALASLCACAVPG